jgi:hypothetical protein
MKTVVVMAVSVLVTRRSSHGRSPACFGRHRNPQSATIEDRYQASPLEAFMTQQELNRVWAAHLRGGHGDDIACGSTDRLEIIESVVSGRSWARPLGGSEWSEVRPASTNAISELLREF